MNYNVGDIITFSDNKEYQVLKVIKHNNATYLFLTFKDDEDKSQFVILKEKFDNEKYHLVNLEDEVELTTILSLLGSEN